MGNQQCHGLVGKLILDDMPLIGGGLHKLGQHADTTRLNILATLDNSGTARLQAGSASTSRCRKTD
jgi:hypothetical protein